LIIELFWHPIRSTFLGSTAPVLSTIVTQKQETLLLFERIFTSERTLQRQVDSLQDEVYRLQFEGEKSDLVRRENKALRSLLNFKESGDLKSGVIAQVVQKPGGAQTDQMLVLSGESTGLVGKSAFYGPYRLGRVSQVVNNLATIDLYSTEPIVRGILAHEVVDLQSQGTMLFMSKIPKSAEVDVGDVVVLEKFPNDPFVVITDIVVDEIDPFKTIFAKLPVAFSDISYVTLQ